MEGQLQDRRLLVALRVIGRRRKTGILTIQGRDEIIAFSFSAGGIVGADALNQSLEEGLGGVLASQQLIDPSEFASLVAEHEAGGGRVVDLLVERSYLSRGQLLESLRLHTYRLCLEALSWRSGEYRFYQGDEVAFEAGVEPIGIGELLVRSSQDLGDAGLLLLPVPQLGDVYTRTQRAFAEDPEGDEESVMTESARRVLESVDGSRGLAQIAASSDLTPFDVQELASEWTEAGIIEKTGSAATMLQSQAAPDVLTGLDLEAGGETTSETSPGPTLDLSADASEPAASEPTRAEPAEPVRRAEPSEPATAALRALSEWVHRLFGLSVLAATVLLMVMGPARVLLPFPWQGALREGLYGVQRSAQRLKMEQAAQTFFLLSGRYPEELGELRDRGLVEQADLMTPEARPWRINATPASFILSSPGPGDETESQWTTSIVDNFLLDPEFVRMETPAEGPLLVLLD